ncbi:SDR family NAD(P)-dependent oxidoreductase [Neolewinella persica]|uniref:SDR family NAD(P)-dependent oxidoreductase n=1 Tax=Neolewinella persica TaxID=70998 RepID=UPI000373ADF1|nr:SDR family NAD(P)-dependent oxidoreductase [Neolewinella persica]
MLSLAIAYSTANQTTAHRIAGDLSSHVSFDHVTVGKANEGPVLADLLKDYTAPIIVLVSNDFLTNPNCMLRGHEIFGSKREVLPIFIKSHHYDELTDEVETEQTSLSNLAEVMRYVNHWQDRYIDLRRDAEELSSSGGEAFNHYLRKIRETSVHAEELLYLLKDSWSLTEAQFAGDHYHQLFIFAERPRLWEEFKDFESAAPMDLSGIPGLEMLSTNTEEDQAGTQVQEEVEEEQADPAPDPVVETEIEDIPMEKEDVASQVELENSQEEVIEQTAQMPEMTADEQVNTWIERSWSMHDEGDSAAGLELLNAGRDALPDHLKLHYHYALLLATATEDTAAARREVEALLDKNPDHLDGLYLNGELALAAGDLKAARENWEALSDAEPFYPGLNYELGTFLAEHYPADYLDAAAYLRRATKDKHPVGDAFYRYALLLAGPIGRRKKAIKVLRAGISADPSHAFAHYELAVLLHERGDLAEARNYFRVACSLNPAFKTEANQRAFAAAAPVVIAATPAEEDALAALKRNIASLEAMMAERDAAPEPDPEPAPPPLKGAGKTILISGASAGIGRATARRLAAEGYRLILIGRRKERLEDLAEELDLVHETETLLLELDVRNYEDVASAISSLPEEWSTIDVLINNAGKAKGVDPIHEGQIEHWEEMIDVNLKGLLYLTREVSPKMVEREEGTIINVCSTAGKEVYPNGNVYCATKHAVDALTHATRLDLVKYGIRVGQICPAMVEETEFSLVRYDGDAERAKIYEDFQPLRASDVAEAVCFMITQPRHVNVLDLVLQGTQQASSTVVDRSGRARFAPEEE